ncbi:MAG: hypothetical protein KZQ64_12260 [gamma proteobacterium symbiont of Bathyaustriella thionipta]|nr:hypothetical protein [gamma proteobacterium symbiont of Bathyaustriella thionipta]MCU7948446.1 hypothetical protein [gamma proteobacterium symbiont of Bathyaustriella thionipta]MCU7954145.1 hypothetical protein [gamma proteobacterium symbiont of Bathyaustriella thionipta]MCU7955996.1 hypothetical protein [gamma proteobacterium symbiont of Bathyaustriella thionipta]MCU7967439.1 hypothetical protein [gamma proteobacterium symbiont of Bathyaustriella thionipta]
MKKQSNNKQDDNFFDDYLEGKSSLSEIYQQIDSAEPSDKLNQSILSAARVSTEQTAITKNSWTQTASWAASVAAISLVGILAHNTWQAEQDAAQTLEEDGLPSLSQPERVLKAKPGKAEMESSMPAGRSAPAHARAKKNVLSNSANDSRKLLYKSAPAPVMPSAPGYFELNKTESLSDKSQVQAFEDAHKEILASPAVEAKKIKQDRFSEQQIMLNKIIQLIDNNKIEQAQKLLFQFKTNYPNYPVDPVILKHLSPY